MKPSCFISLGSKRTISEKQHMQYSVSEARLTGSSQLTSCGNHFVLSKGETNSTYSIRSE